MTDLKLNVALLMTTLVRVVLCSLLCLLLLSGKVYASTENISPNIESNAITGSQGAASSISNVSDSQSNAASSMISKDIIPSKNTVIPKDPEVSLKDPAASAKTFDKSPETKLAQADTGDDADTSTDASKTSDAADTGQEDTVSASSSSDSGGSAASSSTNGGAFSSVRVDTQTNSGIASTGIPIEVPEGRKNMTPRIVLKYSSSKKNGWLGMGWMLDMGAIQRETRWGLDYNSDKFVFVINDSSSRLEPIGGNYYAAKIEGEFSRYYYDSGARKWIVTAKNGTKYYFGSAAGSRQDDPTDSTRIFKWCLDRVEDTNGNFMEIFYTKSQGEIYLDEIKYTGSTKGLPTTNSIKFMLQSRTDAHEVYTTHFSVKTASRLRAIEVRGNGQLARKYELFYEYGASTSRSRLKSVTMYGHDGGPLPPVTFTYSEAANGFSDAAIQWHVPDENLNGYNWGVRFVKGFAPGADRTTADIFDINGDALPDRLLVQDPAGDMYVYPGNGTGFDDNPLFIVYQDYPVSTNSYTYWQKPYEYGLYVDRRSFDMNGDGMPDTVYWGYKCGYYSRRLCVALNTGQGYLGETDWNWSAPPPADSWFPFIVSWDGTDGSVYQDNIDMNGDGLPDRVTSNVNRSAGANYLLVYLNTGSGFINTAITWNTPVTNGGWKQDVRSSLTSGPYSATYQDIIDMNGDGLPDRVTSNVNRSLGANYLLVYLNTGSGFSNNAITWNTPATNPGWPQDVRSSDKPVYDTWSNSTYQDIIDMNGDGLPDRVTSNANRSAGVNYLLVYLNTGSGFSNTAITWNTPVTNSAWKQDVVSSRAAGGYCGNSSCSFFIHYDGGAYQSIMDITGDGLPDRVTNTGCVDYLWVYPSSGLMSDLLTKIDNGLGGITEIEYNPSTKYKNTYLPFVQDVVSKVTVKDGKGSESITTFDYAGGFYSAAEKEFRGFNHIKSTAPNGTITETWFNQDDIYKGLTEAQVIKDPSNNVYSWVENTYNSNAPYSGITTVVFPFLERRDEYIYDASAADAGTETDYQTRKNNFLNAHTANRRHIINQFTYDGYGNVSSKYEAENPLKGDERTEYIEYYYDTVNYIVALPSRKYMADGAGAIKAQTWYTYYSDGTGNLWKRTQWLSGGTDPVTTYTYDPYGNVATIKDPRNNTSTISYDPSYTYPVQMANPLGHTIQKTYDPVFIDKVKTETDPNANTTTYDYDEFGRTSKITKPAPYGITEYKYQNYGDPYSQNVREEAKDGSGNLIHFKETYFDGIGRTTSEMQGGPGAATIVVDIEYNNKGLVWKKSYPYFSGDPVYKTTYTYDPVDRLINTLNPDGTSSSTYYDRAITTYVDANAHMKATEKDIYERIITVEEYTGNSTSNYALYASTYYWYDVLGNLTNVMDANGNPTTIIYDTLSRKKEMYDPDMGHWVYDYDANGNLTYQKDAMNQEIWFDYDELNRVTLKDYPDGTDITYVYDEASSTNAKGRMTTVTDSSGTTVFNYDALGQITRSDKTLSLDSSTYITQTQYDPLGRVKKIIYPDNAEVDYTYDGNGNIKDIKNGTQPYVAYNSYTAIGNPLSIAYGNGVNTTYQYYPENNRLKRIYTTNGTTGLMDLEYLYDNVGNITLLTDHLDSNKTRSYTYDDLDRLTESDSPSYGGKLLYQYDKIGNMTYNCKFGHYYYEDENHVHAVTSVRKTDGTLAADYQYDENGNMIHSHDYGINVSRDFTYDYDNMPTSIAANGAVISKYDAFGTRVTKTVPVAGTTKYIGQIYECSGTGCTKYIFSGTQRIAEIDSTGTHYYHTDHLGSSTVLTDENGAIAQDVYYYPYGEILSNSISNVTDYLYTGKEWDAETGLYYYGARYYDPKLARFISADTIVPMPFYPQTLNRYAYAYNNPVVLRDLNGHCAETSGWSSFSSWASSAWSSFSSAVSSFVTTVTTTAVSMAANFAATFAAAAVGIATGFNANAMNSVVGTILSGANALSGAIAGTIGGSPSLSLFGGFGDGGGASGYDNYAANDNGAATDAGKQLTLGEQILKEALDYKGEKGMHCNELVIQSIKDAGQKVNYFNTKNIGDSPYVRQLAVNEMPRTGDIAVWSGKHMGFYVSPSLGYMNNGLVANIFHAPGANSSHAVGFSNINSIYSTQPTFFRYTGGD